MGAVAIPNYDLAFLDEGLFCGCYFFSSSRMIERISSASSVLSLLDLSKLSCRRAITSAFIDLLLSSASSRSLLCNSVGILRLILWVVYSIN